MERLESYRASHPAHKQDSSEPAWLRGYRKSALASFEERGFPSRKSEAWKYTSLKALQGTPFSHTQEAQTFDSLHSSAAFTVDEFACELVFVNGVFSAERSSFGDSQALTVVPLQQAIAEQPDTVRTLLGADVVGELSEFEALNSAFLQDGVLLSVASGTEIALPIVLTYIGTSAEQPLVTHPRNIIAVEPNCRLSVLERYLGADDGVCFHNAVTTLMVGRGSTVEHVLVQDVGLRSFHMGLIRGRVEDDATLQSHIFTLGGHLVRNELDVDLLGTGARCELGGLVIGSDHHHIDHQTTIRHSVPGTSSRQIYKGVADDKAHTVFNGRVLVAQDAQQTNAEQRNDNLLLSDTAVANSKPQLEIFADDVRCSHGATVGQLDEDALFYLRARGIPREQAVSMLIEAFADDRVQAVASETIANLLRGAVQARLQELSEVHHG